VEGGKAEGEEGEEGLEGWESKVTHVRVTVSISKGLVGGDRRVVVKCVKMEKDEEDIVV
jgi:hypothetical protein